MAKKKRPPASASIMMLSLELLAVGLFTLMAGANDDMGTIMILMMTAFWIIFAITESKVISGLGNALTSLVGKPNN